jgi:trk system potassium uptake protein TrkH
MRINIRYILKTLGSILILETIFLLIAAGAAFVCGDGGGMALMLSAAVMAGVGGVLFFIGRHADEYRAGRREGMLAVTLTWTLLSLFGMMPFFLNGHLDNFTDAYLETMSGFTTTGMTTLTDVESLPRGILLWRSLLQWQGGIGMVVFTIALLPMFGGSASQLFDAETTGFSHERFRPRVTQVAKRLSGVYLLLTLLIAFFLWTGPMDLFDALNHAMTSISTGGYSTRNASIAHWNSPYVDYVVMIGMCLGGMKMPLFFFALKGDFRQLRNDEETRWYLLYLLFFILLTVAWLLFNGLLEGFSDIESTVRHGAFQVITLATTTGFSTADSAAWGEFYGLIVVLLMVVCGCGGSTSGGLKMGRALILVKNMLNEFRRQTHPAAVLPVRVNGRAVAREVIDRVHIFLLVYLLLICAGCLFLLFTGLTFEEALATTVSAASNVGLSLGKLSGGDISSLTPAAKWCVSFIMMTGRLEIFTVLTLLLPGFWRR